MTSNLPIKSSSRAGRFKKKLVTEQELLVEAPILLEKIAPFKDLLSAKKISPAEFAACYIICFLSHRFPGSWLGTKITMVDKVPGTFWQNLPFSFEPNILKRLNNIDTLTDIFSHFSLKSTPLSVNRSILEWLKGNYPLELMFRIPRPHEILAQQKIGRRCVTTLTDKKISKYILGQRDTLSFTMHDLIHADHFYLNNSSYEGQLGFYGLLDKTISYFDLSNESFSNEFEYLISDMNAYPIHLLKCLKSAMVFYYDENYFLNWLELLSAPDELIMLNTPNYHPEKMDELILNWLSQFKSPYTVEIK